MSTDGRMEKEDAAYLYNGILATKMNEIMLFVAIWMDLETVTLSEIRQKRRSILWHSLYMDSKMKWHKWAYLQNRKRLTENELTVARGEGWGEGQLGCLEWTYADCCFFKWITNKDLCIAHGSLLNVMWQPGQEGSLEENGFISTYDWGPLLFTWNYHNIGNLYPSTK